MGRHYRRKVTARFGPASLSYEWVGFRDAGLQANLDTATAFELLPPVSDTTVGSSQFTVHRVVGQIAIMKQAGIVSGDNMGIVLQNAEVGDDQTADEDVDPLSTDIDEFANKGIMWWWSGRPPFPGPVADADLSPWIIPIDIKVKRIVRKRNRLVFSAAAATAGRLRMTVNVRVLITHRNA